ncbi:hypothetical protein ISS07_04560, partial [Candidatus Woesearchaeota archaeon]|nr:hypothetical protein [Candidatus Woesearchaeota archaeon]
MDDDYEIMPHRQVADLKKQLEEIKSKQESSSSNELVGSMSSLTKSMDSMLKLFTEAAEELKVESKGEHEIAQNLNPLNDKLDEIIEQNKTIAEGMIAIHDTVKEFVSKSEHIQQKPQPVKSQFQAPDFHGSMPSLGASSQLPPGFSHPPSQPNFGNAPIPDVPPAPRPMPNKGPVAMPSMSLDDLDHA